MDHPNYTVHIHSPSIWLGIGQSSPFTQHIVRRFLVSKFQKKQFSKKNCFSNSITFGNFSSSFDIFFIHCFSLFYFSIYFLLIFFLLLFFTYKIDYFIQHLKLHSERRKKHSTSIDCICRMVLVLGCLCGYDTWF